MPADAEMAMPPYVNHEAGRQWDFQSHNRTAARTYLFARAPARTVVVLLPECNRCAVLDLTRPAGRGEASASSSGGASLPIDWRVVCGNVPQNSGASIHESGSYGHLRGQTRR